MLAGFEVCEAPPGRWTEINAAPLVPGRVCGAVQPSTLYFLNQACI
jgi:hypothetical protein